MTHPCPNRLVVGKNDAHFATHFGMCYSVAPMHHVSGLGHQEQLEIACYGGLCLEISRAFAIELARRLPEAIAHMPFVADDIHDAAADIEGQL
jgi:hypothetical protein